MYKQHLNFTTKGDAQGFIADCWDLMYGKCSQMALN